jgi:predicted MFS family arabinose efflux permease
VLLGVPALALPAAGVAGVMVICVLRGAGLAIIFVVCGGLGAALIPPDRRGEGLGVFGAVVGVPAVVATPIGVWLADRAGYPVVFVLGAVTALLALAAIRGIPGRAAPAPGQRSFGVLAAARTPNLTRVSVMFAASAIASGVVITFLPVAVPRATGDLVPLALLVNATVGTAARWWAGRLGDRYGARRLLVPGVLTAAAGLLALFAIASPVAVVAGMVLVGAGFGVAQNASMAMLLERVPESGYDAVSALWSVAYDSGFGLGALAVGAVASQTGYPIAFAATGVLVAASAVRVRATGRRRSRRLPAPTVR